MYSSKSLHCRRKYFCSGLLPFKPARAAERAVHCGSHVSDPGDLRPPLLADAGPCSGLDAALSRAARTAWASSLSCRPSEPLQQSKSVRYVHRPPSGLWTCAVQPAQAYGYTSASQHGTHSIETAVWHVQQESCSALMVGPMYHPGAQARGQYSRMKAKLISR